MIYKYLYREFNFDIFFDKDFKFSKEFMELVQKKYPRLEKLIPTKFHEIINNLLIDFKRKNLNYLG